MLGCKLIANKNQIKLMKKGNWKRLVLATLRSLARRVYEGYGFLVLNLRLTRQRHQIDYVRKLCPPA